MAPNRGVGTGPGTQTEDGCSVDLYRQIPYQDDLEDLRAILRAGASILELGCGVGRLTAKLIEWGLHPTLVDNSPEMLACIPTAIPKVCTDIEALALAERFDLVLLASFLVNSSDRVFRKNIVATAAKHLNPSGKVLIQRRDPESLLSEKVGQSGAIGPIEMTVIGSELQGAQRSTRLQYKLGEQIWTHSFVVQIMNDDDIYQLLEQSGLKFECWADDRKTWLVAGLK